MRYRKAKLLEANKIGKLLTRCFNITSAKEGKETYIRERKTDNFIVAEEKGKMYGLVSWETSGLPKHQLVRIERICLLAFFC
jgi:N-acetylglutamate synthase-like GNAT family acetyltransferase